MDTERIAMLQQVALFGGVSEATLELLAGRGRQIRVAAGDAFFYQGDMATAMYLLESGRVIVFKTWRGEDCRLRFLEAGDCFGEMALIDFCPRSASVLALEDCRALEITTELLHEIYCCDLEQFTLIQMNMAREVSRRLRESDEVLFRVKMGEHVFDRDVAIHSG